MADRRHPMASLLWSALYKRFPEKITFGQSLCTASLQRAQKQHSQTDVAVKECRQTRELGLLRERRGSR